ncbi:hypothetical protein MFMK1_000543 [Metallumcola ferriviriculae]|uniref:DUF2933 domain-containing protein n=1 Tax=Metallumcola ferriviriculae TaxID=3039180 RepID=A0AAU0UHJ3_9FIRM|nr:hypothetical protein MFMK1_000543 [Desulfitibacteraceae bacterium MK1]
MSDFFYQYGDWFLFGGLMFFMMRMHGKGGGCCGGGHHQQGDNKNHGTEDCHQEHDAKQHHKHM